MNRSLGNPSLVVSICLILVVALWLVIGDIRAPVPTQYDYDEGVYAATADAVARGGRLYHDVFLSQPPLFILTLRAMFGLEGASLAVARNTAVGFAVVWLIALLAILWARGTPDGALLAVCLLLGRAAFLDAARTVEMEVPSEALACAAVALAAWGLRRPGPLWWAGAGALASLAMMTKLTAVTAMIPLIGAAVSEPGPARSWRWRMLVAGSLPAFGVFLPVVGTAGFVDQVFAFHLALAQKLGESVATHAAAIWAFMVREWPLAAAALLGGWRVRRSGTAFEHSLVVWFAIDVVALAALSPLWPHHLLILISPLALLAGSVLRQRGERRLDREPVDAGQRRGPGWPSASVPGPRRGLRVAALVVLVACALAYLDAGMATARRLTPSPLLERVVHRINQAVPADGKILTDDPMVVFLARRSVVDGLTDSSLTRIWAGQISEEHLIATLRANGTDAVVLWRGTFQQYFPRLPSAAARAFPVTETVSERRMLFFRRPD